MCLAKLHNFCIDERDIQQEIYAPDEAYIELFGAVPMDSVVDARHQPIPLQLLGGGIILMTYQKRIGVDESDLEKTIQMECSLVSACWKTYAI